MAQGNCARPSLLERRVVEERVGAGVQNLVGKGGRLHRVHAVDPDRPRLDPRQQLRQGREVGRLVQAVVEGLLHQGVVRNLDRVGDVVLTRHLVREDRAQELVGAHSLDG